MPKEPRPVPAAVEERATTRLRARRLESGLTQSELAGRAGVSRQLVAAVEGERHAPSVESALALARALERSVEELFSSRPQRVVPALGGSLRAGVPLRVGSVGEQLVTAELADHGVAGAGWATPDAIAAGGAIELFPGADPAGLVLAGCDPAFGIAERMLERLGARSLLAVPAPTGVALSALRRGSVHAAVVHGLDERLPRPPLPVSRWHVARWRVGLGVAPALRATSLEQVLGSGVRVVQRNPAATSQRAFERARLAGGIAQRPTGPIATGHLDAARIASILGGAGVTTEGAARAFGLRFVPLEEHTVELWAASTWSDHPGLSALLDLLNRSAFTRRVAGFGGYDLERCGASVTTAA